MTTLVMLCGCAVRQEPPPVTIPGVAKRLTVLATELPCAEVSSIEPVMIRYPAENLYRNGAILPGEEGLRCLEALAAWLKSVPQSRWQVVVNGEEGYGFESLDLAAKRQELLQRFFIRKGVAIRHWEWQTVAGQGEQMQLLQLKDSL
jgi:hypothetical protein